LCYEREHEKDRREYAMSIQRAKTREPLKDERELNFDRD